MVLPADADVLSDYRASELAILGLVGQQAGIGSLARSGRFRL